MAVAIKVDGSIPLHIHEVLPRPKRGVGYGQKNIPKDHFIGHFSDKRADNINQNQERLNILCQRQEKTVLIFRHPL